MKINANEIYCSCYLSRKLNKEAKSHRLSELSKQFEVQLTNHHRAVDDTFACLNIFLKLTKEIKSKEKLKANCYLFNTSEFEKVLKEDIPKHLTPLTDYCSEGKIIEIKYKGGKQKNSFRSVKAVSLLPLPNGNVLYAHCQKRNLLKYYKLDKITELRSPE